MTLETVAKNIGKTLLQQSPHILTGLGVAGLVSTTVLAVKATPEAIRRIDHERNQRALIASNHANRVDYGETGFEVYEFVEPWDDKLGIIKLVWKLYIPAASVGIATGAAIIGSDTVNSKRQAALIGAYSLIETGWREYKEKVVEKIGVSKEQTVRDEIAQERVDSQPVSNQVIVTGSGEALCFDTLTGRYFNSSIETIRKGQNDINLECINNMYASQNDFYRMIGLKPVDTGEVTGWTTAHPMELVFTSVLTEDNRPAIAVGYRQGPITGFHKIW